MRPALEQPLGQRRCILGLTLHNTVAYYIPIIYMTSYIVSVAKLAPSSALWIGTSCLLVFVILIPIWGALSDRIGRKPLLLHDRAE